MSADEAAMMEAWQKAMTPGANHSALEPVVGTFSAKVKMWMEPGAPAQDSEGISENRWALGGRYVEQRYKGMAMGMPFEGIGFTGYDNVQQKYVGTWMDTFTTGIMSCLGTGRSSAEEIAFKNECHDPMTGKAMTMRSVVRILDKNRHRFEMFATAPDGKEFKMMEIEYTRK